MASPLQPEFFALLGIDLFLAISLITCLLDKHFPWQIPYIYQLAALAGFGQLLVSREFLTFFDDYMRFWYSLLYMVVAVANIIAVNVYLGMLKKLLKYAKVYMFTVTFPALSLAVFFLSSYAEVAVHPLVIAPQISWPIAFIGIVAFDTFVVGLGVFIFFKPKWWNVAAGAGTAIAGATIYTMFRPLWGAAVFVVSAIALAIACSLVLGVSIYILVRIWIKTIKEGKVDRR